MTAPSTANALLYDTTPQPRLTPSLLRKPAYVMNFPFSYSATAANNAWMRELAVEDRSIDARKAYRQWLEVYHFLASEALVYVLPTPPDCALQDLVFTANLGVALEHVPERDVIVLSNFTTDVRAGEAGVGRPFFEAMGYRVFVPPHKFEGDAELKHLHDDVYVGGYGQRSDRESYRWMEEEFDMRVVALEEADEYLYHLDCTVFPVTREDTLVCTEMFEKSEIAELEEHTNIHDVSIAQCFSGICNSLRINNTLINSSHVQGLEAGTDEYRDEVDKNRRLVDLGSDLGFEVNFFNLSEYHKGGALLSCMVMHLNRNSYEFQLL
jgi:N-dimethylarginine dimethylaminohydrolase